MASRRDGLDILLAKLNTSGIQLKNTPLYEVIAELIKQIKLLKDESNSGSGSSSSSVVNLTTIQQYIDVFGDGSSGDDNLSIPGRDGIKGDTGATGAQGPPFPALIYLEPDLPEDILPIPGPVGPTGATGATGAEGQRAIGFVLTEEADVEELPQMPPSSGGGSPWELIEARAVTGVNNEDFINLSNYSEILAYVRDITKSIAGTVNLRVSTDNGATYLATSGDYISYTTAGVTTNLASMVLHSTTATAARTGMIIIRGFNTTGEKPAQSADSVGNYGVITTTRLNAVRVFATNVGNMTAGTIYLYGRR